MSRTQAPLRPRFEARLQLFAATALLAAALAFPAEDRPAAKDLVSSADASAAVQLAAVEDVAVKSPEPTQKAKVNKKRSQSHNNVLAPLLEPRDSTAETASLSPQIPDPQKKGNAVQGLLLNILQPKPIVDTIREEDKYGNSGDKFAVIGRGVVAGFEGFSNILNKVLDFPFETAKKVSRSATEALNQLGSRLIGL